MTRDTQPLLTATPLAEGGDAVGVGGVGVGLRRYKGVFEGQYGLFLPFLKAQNSGSVNPAFKEHHVRWVSSLV